MEVSVRSVDVTHVNKRQCIFVEGTDIPLATIRTQLSRDGLVLPDCFAFVTKNDNQITRRQEERVTLGHICDEEAGMKIISIKSVKSKERSNYPVFIDARLAQGTGDSDKPQVSIKTQDTLIINIYDGSILEINIKPKDKIENVKKKISEQAGISTDRQELYCNGMPLEDQTDVKVLKPGMVIQLVEKIEVILKTLCNETFIVRNLTPTDLVKKLKTFIEMHKGLPEEQFKLLFRSKDDILSSDRTLSSYGIKHNSQVVVVQLLRGS